MQPSEVNPETTEAEDRAYREAGHGMIWDGRWTAVHTRVAQRCAFHGWPVG